MELHNCFIKPIARSGCFLTSPKPPSLAQVRAPGEWCRSGASFVLNAVWPSSLRKRPRQSLCRDACPGYGRTLSASRAYHWSNARREEHRHCVKTPAASAQPPAPARQSGPNLTAAKQAMVRSTRSPNGASGYRAASGAYFPFPDGCRERPTFLATRRRVINRS
jgi:hypothetical protein